mgnify:FL=1
MKKKLLRTYFDNFPEIIKKIIRKLYRCIDLIPFTKRYKRRKWIKEVYSKFGQEQRKNIFLSCARFCHINRPVDGYYFEFGCHEANTMRMAYDHFHHLFDWIYVAFDSFEGLPEISEIDKQEIWERGKLKTSENRFIHVVTRHGMPRKKLITVKGFYDVSLDENLKKKLLPTKAAVVYIDCDLYKSTVPVLDFIKDFLQKGTIIIFDDWYCFHGDTEKGERRAFAEFKKKNPGLVFEDFVQTNEAKSFVFIGENNRDE